MQNLLGSMLIAMVLTTALPAATARSGARPQTVLLPAGVSIPVRLARSLDTRRDPPGTPFTAHVSAPLTRNGVLVVPRGAVCHGRLMNSKASGRLTGRAVMTLRLDSINVGGRSYAVSTSARMFVSKDHAKRNALAIGGTSAAGAAVGAMAGDGVGALIGAGAGAAAGTAGAAITGKRQVRLAPESRVTFTLRAPVRVRV